VEEYFFDKYVRREFITLKLKYDNIRSTIKINWKTVVMKIKTQTLITTTLILVSSFASAGLYRWVDDKGEVHFSDKVPVAASKKAHTKIDKSGITQKELDPAAKIALQKELELQAQKEEAQEKIENALRKKRAKQYKLDQQLLSTYENKQEIMNYFETKIKMLKGNSNILLAHKKRLQERVDKLNLKKENELKVVNIKQTIDQYEKALKENNKELLSLKTDFESNLLRYIELTK